MSSFLPLSAWGPITFSSGYAPKRIDGPKRTMYVLEHDVPGREGGIVEYLGSKQATYRLQGFLAPVNDTFNGVAAANLSGSSYIGLSADDAMHYLQGLRGSGAQLLRLESAWSNYSGYAVLYENDFFYATSMTFGMEAGRGYPYYPYTIDLMRASYSTFGNSSGTTTLVTDLAPASLNGAFMSGYTRIWALSGGRPQGGTVMGLGFYCQAATSGFHARLAIYNASFSLLVQSASQPITSGWNYFPLNPSLTTTSGTLYELAMMSDATAWPDASIAYTDTGSNNISAIMSGTAYSAGFQDPFNRLFATNISGYALDVVMVTT